MESKTFENSTQSNSFKPSNEDEGSPIESPPEYFAPSILKLNSSWDDGSANRRVSFASYKKEESDKTSMKWMMKNLRRIIQINIAMQEGLVEVVEAMRDSMILEANNQKKQDAAKHGILKLPEVFRCMWGDCEENLDDRTDLWAHVDIKHFFRCRWGDCENESTNEYEFKSHVWSHAAIVCHLCGTSVRNRDSFVHHYAEHHVLDHDEPYRSLKLGLNIDQGSYYCLWDDCSSPDIGGDDLWDHLRHKHVEVNDCEWGNCKYVADDKLNLKCHIHWHINVPHLYCMICGIEQPSVVNYKIHLRNNHSNQFRQYGYPPNGIRSGVQQVEFIPRPYGKKRQQQPQNQKGQLLPIKSWALPVLPIAPLKFSSDSKHDSSAPVQKSQKEEMIMDVDEPVIRNYSQTRCMLAHSDDIPGTDLSSSNFESVSTRSTLLTSDNSAYLCGSVSNSVPSSQRTSESNSRTLSLFPKRLKIINETIQQSVNIKSEDTSTEKSPKKDLCKTSNVNMLPPLTPSKRI